MSWAMTHVSWAKTHVSWAKTHVPWAKTHVSWPKTHVSWPRQNDRDRKIRKFFGLRRQKVKVRGSPETRFGKVSRRSEPSSRGKRPFENAEPYPTRPWRTRIRYPSQTPYPGLSSGLTFSSIFEFGHSELGRQCIILARSQRIVPKDRPRRA